MEVLYQREKLIRTEIPQQIYRFFVAQNSLKTPIPFLPMIAQNETFLKTLHVACI
jgi:hypothetical protein